MFRVKLIWFDKQENVEIIGVKADPVTAGLIADVLPELRASWGHGRPVAMRFTTAQALGIYRAFEQVTGLDPNHELTTAAYYSLSRVLDKFGLVD